MERIVVLAAALLLCYVLLRLENLLPAGGGWGGLVLLTLSMAARWWLWDSLPSGAEDAVQDALTFFRGAGGLWGLRNSTEPFSLCTQALLSLCSLRPGLGLDTYKYIGLLFDILLAWCAQRCVSKVRRESAPRLAVFLLALLLPAGLMSGTAAMGESLRWTAVAAAAAAALGGSAVLTGALLGLAVLLHPFALVILPAFWCFPAVRQNTGKALGTALAVYALGTVPLLLLGREAAITLPIWPKLSPLLRYRSQLGAPGIFAQSWYDLSPYVGTGAYALLLGLTVFRLSGRDAVYDRRRQLAGLCAACLGTGLLLPWAPCSLLVGGEALTLALCALEPGLIPAAVCASAASAFAVGQFFFPELLPWPLWWASAALLAAVAILFGYALFHRG